MSRIKNASRNIIFGILNKCIAILGPFVMRTIIIYKLGAEYVGLNGMFTSLLQVLNFAELGFSNAIVFSMYKPVAENNIEKICEIINYLKKIYKVISIIILIMGIVLVPFLNNFIKGDVPQDINIYILYFIYLLNLIIGYILFAYKSSILLAYQRNDIDSFIQMICNILMYIFQAILLLNYKNYYAYVICLPIITILINLLRNYKVNKMYPEIIPKGNIDIELKKDIKKKILALAGHKIGLPITNSIDSLVVSSYLGLTALAIFDNYNYVFQAIGTILTICYTSITPIIGNSIVIENVRRNYATFLNLSFINFWVVSWFSICMLILYQNFMYIWVGKDLLLSYQEVLFFSIAFFVAYIRFISTTYKDACGMWREDKYKPYVICFGNIILDIISIKYLNMGIKGVIISTLLLRAFIAIPWETAVLFKYYFKIGLIKYLKILLRWICIYVLAASITFYVSINIVENTYTSVTLIQRTIIAIIIPNIIFIIFNFKDENFIMLIKRLKNLIKEKS